MSILTITGLTHRFEDKLLFEDASFTVNNGEHTGIVGLNGAGKSTFLNIIAGRVMQDAGEVKWLNGVRWGYLDQHADIGREQTVMAYLESSFGHLFELNEKLEQAYADMAEEQDPDKLDALVKRSDKLLERLTNEGFYDLESRIKKVANGLGVGAFGYDTQVKTLSGGQRAKLMLARLLLEDLDVMLLDEPTNFLDVEQVEWLLKFLDGFKGTFLLISHDTAFLNGVCRVILNIENRQIKKYTGNYEQFMAQRESNAKQYAESYERQQREIKKMEEYIARNKARAATAGMANSRKKMLDRIEVLEKPITALPAEFSFPYVFLNTKEMLRLTGLSVGYKGTPLLPPIDLEMRSDTKLWVRGANGIGKSTLLKTLMRRIPAVGGRFEFHINAKVGYLEQDLEFSGSGINAVSYMQDVYPRMSQKEIRTQLARVGLKNELALRAVGNLSGGEQVRIKLAALQNRPSNILILDEPTNHLDVSAKAALLEALKAYEGAILLVSHEMQFAGELCGEVFDVEENCLLKG